MLFDSVAPEVQMMSIGSHSSSVARFVRAACKAVSARAPTRCGLEGFPMNFSLASSHAWRASGSRGVVALWSKYSIGRSIVQVYGNHHPLSAGDIWLEV